MNRRAVERHLAMLRRRRGRLEERLATWDRGNQSWTRAELSALKWAIEVLEDVGVDGLVQMEATRGCEE